MDGCRLLINLLGELSLRPVLGNAGILDGDSDLVRHSLELDLLVLISEVVSSSDDTGVVLSRLLALAASRGAHDGTSLQMTTLHATIVEGVVILSTRLVGLLLFRGCHFCPLHLILIINYMLVTTNP